MLDLQPSDRRHGAPSSSGVTGDDDELIRTYKGWKGNNEFLFGGRVVFGPDARSILITIFLITAPVIVFCVFVGRKFIDDFPHHRGVSVLAVAIGLILLDLIFLILTSGRDPGIIPRNLYPPEPEGDEGSGEPRLAHTPQSRLPRTKDMIINGITVKIKYCDTCMLYRPPRASHCSICNNCVEKFDHHCPWLGQCIGLRNYRFYFMFVLCSTLLCIYVHVFCWIYVRRIMDAENINIWRSFLKTPASIALIIYTFICVWFVGGLTCFHLYLMSTNQSTYENFRYRYDRHENPFNKGILGNFMEVFCTKVPLSKNSFRAMVSKEPAIPPRTINGSISSPSLQKVSHDIEMGRKPVWHHTVEEELGNDMVVNSLLLLSPPAFYRRTTIICSNSLKSMAARTPETSNRVVVCGGGVIGVCTAYFLAKRGIAVTLVEKSAVACAASGKAGGFLAFDWCDGSPVGPLARASFNLHRSLAEELNGMESYGYRPLMTLSLSVTESNPNSRGLGLPDWVNGPAKTPSTIGTTQTTAQVHPQLFTRKVLDTAREKYGVEVVIGKLEEVRVESGRIEAVVLEDGRFLDTDTVVLAMGPWSSKFEMLSSIFRVYGTKAHSIVLEPKEPNAITPHALFLSYRLAHGGDALDPEVYPRPTGEVYICGMSSQEEIPDDANQVTSNPESIQVLKRVAKTVSSYLDEENAIVKAEQACFLPSTEDGIPVIGEIPGVKGCYVATGHSCWGILNGPATGAALAELIVDGVAATVDLSRFSPSRFTKRRGRV